MTRNWYACPALEPEIELNEIEVNLEPLRYASQENHKKNENANVSHPMCLIQSYMYQPPIIVGCSFYPVEVRSEGVYIHFGCFFSCRVKIWLKSWSLPIVIVKVVRPKSH